MSDQNPFVADDTRRHFLRESSAAMARLSVLTVEDQEEATENYIGALAVNSVGVAPGVEEGLFALLWELSVVTHAFLDGQEVEIDAVCEHERCRDRTMVQGAFFDAAVQGKHNAAVGVAQAVLRDARASGNEPASLLLEFYQECFVLLARRIAQITRDIARGAGEM
jgi:hypothetical protein